VSTRYPIYIPSKGRWQTRHTARALEAKGIPYRIVVEPSEYDAYAGVIARQRILCLDSDLSALGQGSIPVRNWIWEHALGEGHARYWLIDDNVREFYRLNRNRRIPVAGGAIFRCAEDFTDRYENVAFSGFNNLAFAPDRSQAIAPYTLNTRIYSITLINAALPYRWRGRYNEDTDICLRALKDGWVTIQFNAFLADKATTMTMRGGNTDTIYNTGDQRRAFAESLAEQHPDVARVVWKFGRWHHQVDYSPFKGNRLKRRAGVVVPDGPNEYGMQLVRVASLQRSEGA
jgi:hypothetical protein